MATDLLKRLAAMARELERQNADWERTRSVLSEIGVEAVPVPRGFFEELDPLAYTPAPPPGGLRA